LLSCWPTGSHFTRLYQKDTENPSQGIKPRQKAAKGDSHMNIDNNYNPVRLNPADEAAEKCAIDPEFRIAYDALEDEFAALAALLDARLQAGLTQAQVASKMGVSQPVLARIESSLGKQDHSPSLNTLRRDETDHPDG
jgi:DNA-binding XRE family transcriptional regulator